MEKNLKDLRDDAVSRPDLSHEKAETPFHGKAETPFHGVRVAEAREQMAVVEKEFCVLAPDEESGLEFHGVVVNELRYLRSRVKPNFVFTSSLLPRVTYDKEGRARLQENIADVVNNMCLVMIAAIQMGSRTFVWACNTISIFPYLGRAQDMVGRISKYIKLLHMDQRTVEQEAEFLKLKKLFGTNLPPLDKHAINPDLIPEDGYRFGTDFMVLDTLNSLRSEYVRVAQKPFFLGTDIMARQIKHYEFQSPLTVVDQLEEETENIDINNHEKIASYQSVQDLTQEVIWRIKAAYFSDVSGAMDQSTNSYRYKDFGHYTEMDIETAAKNKLLLLHAIKTWLLKLKEIADELQPGQVPKFILGCTELPIAIKLAQAHHLIPPEWLDIWEEIWIDPALSVAHILHKFDSPDPFHDVLYEKNPEIWRLRRFASKRETNKFMPKPALFEYDEDKLAAEHVFIPSRATDQLLTDIPFYEAFYGNTVTQMLQQRMRKMLTGARLSLKPKKLPVLASQTTKEMVRPSGQTETETPELSKESLAVIVQALRLWSESTIGIDSFEQWGDSVIQEAARNKKKSE